MQHFGAEFENWGVETEGVYSGPCPRLPPIHVCSLDCAGHQGESRTTLVFFLGGVTYAEIAALRFLSQMEDGGTEYVIATTKLINGTSWIGSLMDQPRSEAR